MIIGGLQSQLSSGNHFQTSVTDRQTDRQTDGQTDGQTECKPIVPSGFTGGGLIISSKLNDILRYVFRIAIQYKFFVYCDLSINCDTPTS